MIKDIVPEYNDGKWCEEDKGECKNMFHGVKGEMDQKIADKKVLKEDEKKKAGALDKIKIKLKLAKQEDYAEDSESEDEYETVLEIQHEKI